MRTKKRQAWVEPVSGRSHPWKVEGFDDKGCVRTVTGRAMFKTQAQAQEYADDVNDGLVVTESKPTDTPFA